MTDCCSSQQESAREKPLPVCSDCGRSGHPVQLRTMLFMLKPHLLGRSTRNGAYRFCSHRDCRVVYFSEEPKDSIRKEDLRVRVGVKEIDDPIPLCYCFGFDEADIRNEIERKGATSIPKKIRDLIQEGLCACEERNPSGRCCLGDVWRAVHRIRGERV